MVERVLLQGKADRLDGFSTAQVRLLLPRSRSSQLSYITMHLPSPALCHQGLQERGQGGFSISGRLPQKAKAGVY